MPGSCLYSELYVLGENLDWQVLTTVHHLTGALAEKGMGLAEREVAQKPKVLLLCSNVNQVCELSIAVSITLCIEGRLIPNTSYLEQDSCKQFRK